MIRPDEIYEGMPVIYAPKDENGKVYKRQLGRVKRLTDDNKAAFVYYSAARTSLEDLEVN